MKAFAKFAAAGVAGVVLLKLLGGLLLPFLGLVAGAVGLALKLLIALAVGSLVMTIFRRRRKEA